MKPFGAFCNHLFRMELDGDDARSLPRLNYAVGGACGDCDALSEVLDALMVGGVDLQGSSAEQAREEAIVLNINSMPCSTMTHVLWQLGWDVLIQCSSKKDVCQLRTTADCQHRLSGIERGGKQEAVAGVAYGIEYNGDTITLTSIQLT